MSDVKPPCDHDHVDRRANLDQHRVAVLIDHVAAAGMICAARP